MAGRKITVAISMLPNVAWIEEASIAFVILIGLVVLSPQVSLFLPLLM